MNTISFRQLQRMTVKQLLEMCPLTVTVDGSSTFTLLRGDQLPEVKEPTTFFKKSGEIRSGDYV